MQIEFKGHDPDSKLKRLLERILREWAELAQLAGELSVKLTSGMPRGTGHTKGLQNAKIGDIDSSGVTVTVQPGNNSTRTELKLSLKGMKPSALRDRLAAVVGDGYELAVAKKNLRGHQTERAQVESEIGMVSGLLVGGMTPMAEAEQLLLAHQAGVEIHAGEVRQLQRTLQSAVTAYEAAQAECGRAYDELQSMKRTEGERQAEKALSHARKEALATAIEAGELQVQRLRAESELAKLAVDPKALVTLLQQAGHLS
ncbi:MAG: hypothetical protein HOE53_03995 [Candidatus Magasanikbacteria bacterium]|nr:hypothetical protein [Candidatus Magasanikbacteria bacterium]